MKCEGLRINFKNLNIEGIIKKEAKQIINNLIKIKKKDFLILKQKLNKNKNEVNVFIYSSLEYHRHRHFLRFWNIPQNLNNFLLLLLSNFSYQYLHL